MNYERSIIHGIPFFVRGTELYAWIGTDGLGDAGKNVHEATSAPAGDATRMLRIGTYNAETNSIEFIADWRTSAESKLGTWRDAQKSRSRAQLRAAGIAGK